MAKRHKAVALLKTGMPLHLIASEMSVSFQTIVRYMKLQVAEGGITASEVFFGIESGRRELLEKMLADAGNRPCHVYYKSAQSSDISWDEADLYCSFIFSTANRGDMYERIADLELGLHDHIQKALIAEFGPSEMEWWRQGVPVGVRKACVQAREEDPEPVDSPFSYTTFIHLSEILDKNWGLFSKKLPKSFISRKQAFFFDLRRLNSIRNAVMHPVKGKSWSEDDFIFVSTVLKEMDSFVNSVAPPNRALRRTVTFKSRSAR